MPSQPTRTPAVRLDMMTAAYRLGVNVNAEPLHTTDQVDHVVWVDSVQVGTIDTATYLRWLQWCAELHDIAIDSRAYLSWVEDSKR